MRPFQRRWITPALAAAGIGLGALAGYALWSSPPNGSITPPDPASTAPAGGLTPAPAPLEGFPAPDFSLQDTEARTVSLATFRGRTVILNFWATWCEPCRAELPLLDAAAAAHAGVPILTIETGSAPDLVAEFISELRLRNLMLLLDPQNSARDLYHVNALPATFVVDARGVIQFRKIGTLDLAELESLITRYGGLSS